MYDKSLSTSNVSANMLFPDALLEDLQINIRSPNKGIYFQILKYFIQEINANFIISTSKFNAILQLKRARGITRTLKV